MIRTSKVEVGTSPYNWDSKYLYQCTWYVFYRALEDGKTAPTYWDRQTRTGSYTDAKLWLENYREPWVPMNRDYYPTQGDIVVFDGTYGHVAYIESISDGKALLSEYRSGNINSFQTIEWTIGTNYTGALLGYLHYDNLKPVARNTSINQVEVKDDLLRIRNKPSLSGYILGHCEVGFYNVLSLTENDNYTWYEVDTNKYIANVETKYYPTKKENDILTELNEFVDGLNRSINTLQSDNTDLKQRLINIHSLSEVN